MSFYHIGQLIGVALATGSQLALALPRSVWKCITCTGDGDGDGDAARDSSDALRELQQVDPFGAQCLAFIAARDAERSEEHTSELQSLMRISYAVFCLKKKK